MKRIINPKILLVIFLSIANFSVAQKIEQTTYKNQNYYVYPYLNQANFSREMFALADKASIKSFFDSILIERLKDKDLEDWEIKDIKSDFKRDLKNNYRRIDYVKRMYGKKYIDLGREKCALYSKVKYDLNKDIVPCLSPIPDGKYVQYFDTFFMVNRNGILEQYTKAISGIFTIKNNTLDGEAVWLNINGDTLKKGMFVNGLKKGDWMLSETNLSNSFYKKDITYFIENGKFNVDTTITYTHYENGLKEGPYKKYVSSQYPVKEGFYRNNEISGEWINRPVQYTGYGRLRVRIRNNHQIESRVTLNEDTNKVHQIILRHALFLGSRADTNFNFRPDFTPYDFLYNAYKIAYPKKVNLNLEEENILTYDGAEEGDYYNEEGEYYEEEGEYYDEEGDYYGEEEEYYGEEEEYYGYNRQSTDHYYDFHRFDKNQEKFIRNQKLIDSIGIIHKYANVYEKFYPNGQLLVRYKYNNGKLVNEDTIFWDNGRPLDVIQFKKDSNQYIQSVYDYDGKLFKELVFDDKGKFIRFNYEKKTTIYAVLDGFKVAREEDSPYYFYDKLDTLDHEIKDSLVLFRSYGTDSSLLYSRSFVPSERKLTSFNLSVDKNRVFENELVFSDNYESFTGTYINRLDNLIVKGTESGALRQFAWKDTIPQRNMNSVSDIYEISSDNVIEVNGKPYSGPLVLKCNQSKFKIDADKSLSISLTYARVEEVDEKNEIVKAYRKHLQGKKTPWDQAFKIIDVSDFRYDFSGQVYYAILGDYLGRYAEYPTLYQESIYDYDKEKARKVNLKKERSMVTEIKGAFLNGKPDGLWVIKDQFGSVLTEIPFLNGQINGTVKNYDIKTPRINNSYYGSDLMVDTIPKKETYYLSSTQEYKNNLLDGFTKEYNWAGEQLSETFFKAGLEEGNAYEKNRLVYTKKQFENGELNGYLQTFLTLPGKPALKLYDLNFQDGRLNGESVAYHINGKLAKRGFFANGQPIEDYEAFDTLGFKYHYVKFQYGFPVEEKIYEENQLSIKYIFDWRDSVYFSPGDITETESLERLIYKLGLNRRDYDRPYYGRPSLIEKEGIDYGVIKYYGNDSIARTGTISKGRKVSCWKYYNYFGEFLYEVDYFDTIIKLNDSISFSIKGILTDYDSLGRKLSDSFIIEKFEKYDCSHTDHYETRQLWTIWEANDTLHRMNGYVKNYYDNGVIQSEGMMKNGLPDGVWKLYDPYGKLNQVGKYVLGKRDGRWLGGDLSKTKYLGDICLNPNLPNLEEIIKYREKQLDITITNYKLGKALNKEFYDLNLNHYKEE